MGRLDKVVELRQYDYDEMLETISNLKARLRETVALIEVDIAYGKVSDTPARRMVIEQSKELCCHSDDPSSAFSMHDVE